MSHFQSYMLTANVLRNKREKYELFAIIVKMKLCKKDQQIQHEGFIFLCQFRDDLVIFMAGCFKRGLAFPEPNYILLNRKMAKRYPQKTPKTGKKKR